MGNILEELNGLLNQEAEIIEKLNYLRKEVANSQEGSAKFQLKKDVDKNEKLLIECREKIRYALHNQNSKINEKIIREFLEKNGGESGHKKPEHFKFMSILLIFLVTLLIGIAALWGYQKFIIQPVIISKPEDKSIWKEFNDHIYFYNPPFSNSDGVHTAIKREILNKGIPNGEATFKILFFTGKTLIEKEKFEINILKNFRISLNKICNNDPAMKAKIINQIEVQVDMNSKIPPINYFLSHDRNENPFSLVYIYQDKILTTTSMNDQPSISFGMVLKRGKDSMLKFNYSDFHSNFFNIWCSEKNKGFDLKKFLDSDNNSLKNYIYELDSNCD